MIMGLPDRTGPLRKPVRQTPAPPRSQGIPEMHDLPWRLGESPSWPASWQLSIQLLCDGFADRQILEVMIMSSLSALAEARGVPLPTSNSQITGAVEQRRLPYPSVDGRLG